MTDESHNATRPRPVSILATPGPPFVARASSDGKLLAIIDGDDPAWIKLLGDIAKIKAALNIPED